MKSWKKPTNELIDRAYGTMAKQFDHEYFFTRLKNPLWIQPLVERGCFESPPKMKQVPGGYVQVPVWPELLYLKNVVDDVPDEVIKVLLRVPEVDNPRVYDDIVDIALQLDAKQSAKLHPKILEYARLEHHFMAYRFADVLAHWTTENQTAAALKLASALVEFLPDPQDETKRKRREEKPTDLDAQLATLADTRLEPAPRFDDMEYRTIMNKGVRPLAEKEPYRVACILINATANMIDLRTHREDVGKDIDSSDYWFERLTESESDYENAGKSLVHTLTFTCQQAYERRPDSVGNLDSALQSRPWRIFKRLRQHLLARYPTETTKPWIEALVREYDSYDRWEYNYELQQMIRSACENFGKEFLTKRELKRIFDCIRSGPLKYDLSEEEFRQHQRRFHRTQFAPFASVLFDEYKSYFQELEDEANAPISDDDYPPHKTRGGHVFKRSPRSPEDLASLTDEELLAFINEWEKKQDIFEGRNLIEVDIQGLSIAFQTVFKEQIIPNPKRHKFWMQNYHKIERPIFVERMINVMRECVEANNFDNFDEWLTFGEWALSHPDDSEDVIYDRHAGESRNKPNWSNTRWAMGEFIASCFRKDADPPVSARAQLAKLLDTFCTQFDWRLDRHLTGSEPIDEDMNFPRCRALEALVNFGFWLRRSNPEADVPEVTTVLEKRLTPEAEHPLTPPEYAILGKNYNSLFHLNEAWTSKHKSVLFPRSDFSKWLAAFNGFLSLYGPSAPAFESLQDEYEFALQNLKQLKKQFNKRHSRSDQLVFLFGKHLFTLYLLGKYPLTGNESLLEEFYKVTGDNPEDWARLFEDIGRYLSNSTDQLQTNRLNRIIKFFNWRVAAKEPRELREFTFWFNADRLDAQWRLNAYSEVLDITKSEDMSIHMEVKVLRDMLPDHTEKVVECFHKLTNGIGDKNLSIFTEEATTILQAGFGSSDESVRQNAIQARENLLRLGRFDLLELKD